MIYETFSREEINSRLPESATEIKLTAYARPRSGLLADSGKRWGVLLLPGGGYRLTAEGEGEPVALAFLHAGMQAFVLNYSVEPDQWPQAFLEACAAMDFIRRNKEKYGIDRLSVCGFSAGGHLAGCVANLWDDPLLGETLGLEPMAVRPDAAVLCYSVVTAGEYGIHDCFTRLTGGELLPEALEKLSLEKSVTPQNPPTFLWATVTDQTVMAENTMLYASALKARGVPFELHLYGEGPHAMGLATAESVYDDHYVSPHAASWHGLCVEWLKGR